MYAFDKKPPTFNLLGIAREKGTNIPVAGVIVRGIAALTRLSNESADIGLNLIKANKETIDGINRNDDKPEPKQIVFTIADAS